MPNFEMKHATPVIGFDVNIVAICFICILGLLFKKAQECVN